MSRRFVLSAPASNDLDDILSYVLEQSGPERARYVADHLHKAFRKLAEGRPEGFVQKPLIPAELAAAVRKAMSARTLETTT